MEENNEEVKQEEVKSEETSKNEGIKNEAKETFKQAKEQMKDINFKEEAKKGKGLIGKLFKDPIGAIKEVIQDKEYKVFKTALLIVALWIVIVLVDYILDCIVYKYIKFNILTVIKNVLGPVAKVLVPAAIIYMLNKDKESKTTMPTAISAVALVKIPLIISAVLSLLTMISSGMYYIINPLKGFLGVISTVLMFFVVKEMFNEKENEQAIKTFAKVMAIYYICYFVLSFLGISI